MGYGMGVPVPLEISPICEAIVAGRCAERTRSSRQLESEGMPALWKFMHAKGYTAGVQEGVGGAATDQGGVTWDGFKRIDQCSRALECMDRQGWERSFFQRKFHNSFMQATARAFWKNEGAGRFARDHQDILQRFEWEDLAQEVLISTPRRFGKTISVSMFAAALMYSCASVEISIYSTCKRISQKLLRNVRKFMDLVFVDTGQRPYRVIRENAEEIFLQGPEGPHDVRIVNSYPSRVSATLES
jgi:hypothetical protein